MNIPCTDILEARRIRLTGRVQGVGFRPFVYRLARRLNIHGWVQNRLGEVVIHAQGDADALDRFQQDLIDQAPSLSRPRLAESAPTEPESVNAFTVRESTDDAEAHIHLPPDLDVCPDCLRELFDPADRRYCYPFINCTQCGPRYTLAERLPWDRPNTAMAGFALCDACRAEYADPADRRFHAEPVACPQCGPQLAFVNQGSSVQTGESALQQAVAAIADGRIVAVKGIGGYHLICDATCASAVARLRARKPRPHKPLAVMFPFRGEEGLAALREYTEPDAAEAAALRDPARPIVLVQRRPDSDLAAGIAPRMDRLGAFLPYSPLHHLLLDALDRPLVATSGNLGGEPVIVDAEMAEARLSRIADAFLHHDRPIVRPADDSVVLRVGGRIRPLRLGRGLAPLELTLPHPVDRPTLAVGGHMKNTVALAWEDRLIVSPHIGDLDTPRALNVFERIIDDLQSLYRVRAERLVCDAHPGYASTRWARASGLPVQEVFHHHAHAAQLALEHPDVERWLVFAWDGVGLGEDGSLWGGEALLGRPGQWRRVASFRPFRPPGGDRAAREPWRSAAALCWAAGMDYTPPRDPELVRAAWNRGLNAPATTAVGRLFDAAAALLGLVDDASFEGQGPMWLEAMAGDGRAQHNEPLACRFDERGLLVADWQSLLALLLDDRIAIADRAAGFHAILAATIAEQARLLRERHGEFAVGLSGGVFQNRHLAESAIDLLRDSGFPVHVPAAMPCNDGGLCAGQIVEAMACPSA